MRSKASKTRLAELLEERDRLLSLHPELRPMQKEIEKLISKAGKDPVKRSEAVLEMLKVQYQKEIETGQQDLENIKDLIEHFKKTPKRKGAV